MAKIISINLEEMVANLSTKLNHFFIDKEHTCCTFYGTNKMTPSEIRSQLTELALFLSEQGFFCKYTGGDTLDVYLAPPDTANLPSSKEEPTFAMLARIFSQFTITSAPNGYIFLINKKGFSTTEMRSIVKELESRKLNAEYHSGNNFIAVSTSEELESFFTSMGTTTEEKNISTNLPEEEVI